MQPVHFRNKSYKQFLVKNDSGVVRKKFISDFFFHLNFFPVFFLKFLNIVCLHHIQNSHTLQEKIVKF